MKLNEIKQKTFNRDEALRLQLEKMEEICSKGQMEWLNGLFKKTQETNMT